MSTNWIELTGIGPKVEGLHWEANELLRIGRQKTLEVVLDDPSIERIHVEVKRHGPRWQLRDVAKNPLFPTFVNGALMNGAPRELKMEDVLQVGQLYLRITQLGPKMHEKLEMAEVASVTAELTSTSEINLLESVDLKLPDDWELDRPRQALPSFDLELPPISRADIDLPSPRPYQPERIRTSQLDIDLQVEAKTRRTYNQALSGLAPSGEPVPSSQILTLLRANHHLSNLSNLDDLLANTLEDILRELDAQRGAILLLDPVTGQLQCKAVLAPTLPPSRLRGYSRTLAQHCVESNESLLCRDSRVDEILQGTRSVKQGAMASILCALIRSPRKTLGVLHLDRGPLQGAFTESDLYLADAVAASVAVGIECAQLVELQRDQFVQTVTTLARAVEMRDQYTGDHTKRVTDYSLLLAEQLKLGAMEKYQIQIGTPLHDIGKIGIDDAILRKPGKLTTGEFDQMKQHTVKGAEMLGHISSLSSVLPIIRSHHERWDGLGYPDCLAEEKIPPLARIVAVADAFDAMTSHRPYRPAMPPQLAYAELANKAGSHFDPNCVEAFLKIRHQVEKKIDQ